MTDRQAAEAREWEARKEAALEGFASYDGVEGDGAIDRLIAAGDALSVRLAQAEQALRLDDELEMERNTLRARLREYEEALTRTLALHGYTVGGRRCCCSSCVNARAALAASGGREAPDTKEPPE